MLNFFILGIGKKQFSSAKVAEKEKKVDALDRNILLSLSRDARVSNTALARKFSVSKDTITYRIKNLESSGVIRDYRPIINYSALGLSINSVLLKISPSSAFEQVLRDSKSILWATKTVGYHNHLIYVITKNLEEFHDVINEIKEKFDDVIQTYEILFAFEELKYNFFAESIVA